eukprot:5342733-Prymnesium_polylepis.1
MSESGKRALRSGWTSSSLTSRLVAPSVCSLAREHWARTKPRASLASGPRVGPIGLTRGSRPCSF